MKTTTKKDNKKYQILFFTSSKAIMPLRGKVSLVVKGNGEKKQETKENPLLLFKMPEKSLIRPIGESVKSYWGKVNKYQIKFQNFLQQNTVRCENMIVHPLKGHDA